MPDKKSSINNPSKKNVKKNEKKNLPETVEKKSSLNDEKKVYTVKARRIKKPTQKRSRKIFDSGNFSFGKHHAESIFQKNIGGRKKVLAVTVVSIMVIVVFSAFFLSSFFTDRSEPIAQAPQYQEGYEWLYRSTTGLNLRFHVYDTYNANGTRYYKVHADRFDDYGNLAIREEPIVNGSTLDLLSGSKLAFPKYDFPLYDGKTWNRTVGTNTLHARVKYLPHQWYPRYGYLDIFRVSYFKEYSNGSINYNTPYYIWDYAPKIGLEAEIKVLFLGMHFKYQLISFCKTDSDNDGADDLSEQYFGTDVYNPDTDGDGAPDGNDVSPLTNIKLDLTLDEVGTAFNGDAFTQSDIYVTAKVGGNTFYDKQASKNNNVATIEKSVTIDLDDNIDADPTPGSITALETDYLKNQKIDIYPDEGTVFQFDVTSMAHYDFTKDKFQGTEPPIPGWVVISGKSNHPSDIIVPDTWQTSNHQASQGNVFDVNSEKNIAQPFVYGYGFNQNRLSLTGEG